MKKHGKLAILILAMYLGFIQSGNAQKINTFDYDPAPFIGKWVAQSGNRTFELIIQKHRLYGEPFNEYLDLLLGEMTYKTNGVVTRHFETNSFSSIFTGSPSSPSLVHFRFTDHERKVAGSGNMTLDPNNPKRATWKLNYREAAIRGSDWNRVDFDIPRDLVWTKADLTAPVISSALVPRATGGQTDVVFSVDDPLPGVSYEWEVNRAIYATTTTDHRISFLSPFINLLQRALTSVTVRCRARSGSEVSAWSNEISALTGSV